MRHITHSTCIQIKPQKRNHPLKGEDFRDSNTANRRSKEISTSGSASSSTQIYVRHNHHCWATTDLQIMACAALSANSCTIASSSSGRLSFSTYQKDSKLRQRQSLVRFRVRASTDDSDCNAEECAPDKEVGKVSMEWVAMDNTQVVGTFPPRKPRGWTGYVEKDTAGQTNIYSVEPAVYVAESAISSGTAGTSSDGAENTKAISAGIALISIAAASSILLQVGKNSPPPVQTVEYSGPSLSYYINKLKPAEIVQASVTEAPTAPETEEVANAPEASVTEAPTAPETEEVANAPEVESSAPEAPAPQVEVQSEAPQDTSSESSNIS